MAERKRGRPLKEVQERLFAARPALKAVWNETARQREIGVALVRLRAEANLTQSELAEKAGWDKAYVSRLESGRHGMPDLATIQRYCAATGAVAGLVFGGQQGAVVHVTDAITLMAAHESPRAFEKLSGQDLNLDVPLKSTQ